MPLFLDRHDLPGATARDLAAAHKKDADVEARHGVHYVTYWHDEKRDTVFCLAQAPSKEAAAAVHRESHGLEADVIIEVDQRAVTAFLGSLLEPELGEPFVQTAFRAILFTDMEGSTGLANRVGDARAIKLIRAHDEAVRAALAEHGGSEVKHTGDGIMASFTSAVSSVECAVDIQKRLADLQSQGLHVRIGVSAGEPVTEEGDLFGAAVSLASRVCAHCDPGGILVSTAVRELAVGKGFKFADRGLAELKGFDEPVRLYAVE